MTEERKLVRLGKDGNLEVRPEKKKLLRLGEDGNLVTKTSEGSFIEVKPPSQSNQAAFVYLILDNSSSMVGDKLNQAKRGAIDFADSALRQGYEVGVISFNDSARHLSKPTLDQQVIRRSIEGIVASGGTNLTPALTEAFRILGENRADLRSILVVTDGQTMDANNALVVASQIKSSGISILTIGTDDADYIFLTALASASELAKKVSRTVFGQTISTAAKMLPGVENRQLGPGK